MTQKRIGIILSLGLSLALVGSLGWNGQRPAAQPGQVEAQIRSFGVQIAHKLAPTDVFVKSEEKVAETKTLIQGYRAQAAPMQAPAGLLPVERQAWEAMAKRGQPAAADDLTSFFPGDYSEGSLVRGQGMEVMLRPLGSRAAQAQIENGKVVYHDAYPSTDSLQVVSAGHSEEFLLLHNAQAPQRFEYAISVASGVKSVTLENGSIHFKNGKNTELNLETPWLVDAGGKRLENQVHWEIISSAGATQPTSLKLALVVTAGARLRYPLLIDPSWTTTPGSLNTGRYQHTATLLNNGQVLVAGGRDNNGDVLASSELYNPSTGSWTTTGSLHVARYVHTATLLPNGDVLVAGGDGGSGALTSSELYNPSAGTWANSGNLQAARESHTATLLPNGDVLVAGGESGGSALASSELYNNGTWTTTSGALNTAREYHTATLLSNGEVLVAGGDGGSGALASSELYSGGTWTTSGNLHAARENHTATLLPNGQVLVAGGESGGSVLGSSELYNNGTWTTSGNLTTARQDHTAILLPNGKVLIMGGVTNSNVIAAAEIYSGGSWTATTSLNTNRADHTSTLLANGQVLSAGGANSSVLSSSELYDASSGSSTASGSLNFSRGAPTAKLLPNGEVLIAGGFNNSLVAIAHTELYNNGTWTATGDLNVARYDDTATILPNGQVFLAGGLTPQGVTGTTEIYNVSGGIWTPGGVLNTARYLHTATLMQNGLVLFAGGFGAAGTLADVEIYDPATGVSTETTPLNDNRYQHTATLLPNGKVLVAGGNSSLGVVGSAELFDPSNSTWAETGSLNTPRYGHTATLLPNGKVLIAGGVDGSYASSNTAELYNPSNGTWTSTGNLITGRKGHIATLLSNGMVLVTGGQTTNGTILSSAEIYNPFTGTWTATGTLLNQRSQGTATVLSNGKVLLAGGGTTSMINATEVFDPLGYTFSAQPVLTAPANGNIPASSGFTLAGTGFTATAAAGVSEASGGNGAQNSASNYPVAQLESLDNEQTTTLPINSATPFTATSFTSLALSSFPPGSALLNVSVNGTPSVSQVVTLSNTVPQSIDFPAIGSVVYNQAVTLAATASSGLAVTYTVVSGPATLSDSQLTFTGVGPVVISATQAGNGTYAAAAALTQTFTVAQASQTLSPPLNVVDQPYSTTPITITLPTASSGLPVTVVVQSGPAVLTNDQLSFTGIGQVVIVATQNGNADYLAAPPLTDTFNVTQISQTIDFPTITTTTILDTPTLGAIASSGLPITYTVTGPATVTQLGINEVLSFTGTGPVTVTASQAGNTYYSAATPIIQSFSVTLTGQTITFPPIGTTTTANSPLTLSATSSSGLPVTFSVTGGTASASISGNLLTLNSTGTVMVAANAAANASYSAAPTVSQTIIVSQGGQTINFPSPPNQTYGNAPFTVSATASSGLPVTITRQSGPATISGNTVTLTGVGTVVLAANQGGTSNFGAAAQVTASFTVSAGSQTITPFATIASRTFSPTPFTITLPTSSSGLPVTTTVQSGPATISGHTVTLTGVGTVVLAANQAGNSDYTAAPTVTTSFVVSAGTQTISPFSTIAAQTYGVSPLTITLPTASSGLPVTTTVQSGPATISGNILTITGAGVVTLAADQAGNANYSAAAEVTTSFTVFQATQTITFPTIPNQSAGNAPFTISATASSNLPVTFAIQSGHATISGDTITLTGSGTVIVTANQAGNTNYKAAPTATRTFTVGTSSQTITFAALPDHTTTDAPFTISATASSNLTVSFVVQSGPATVSGDTVTLTGTTGLVVIAAEQAGNADYSAAPTVTQSFNVTSTTEPQTITFPAIANEIYGASPFTISATASSNLPVTFSILSGPATISGNTITLTGGGVVHVQASQAGNTTYSPAPNVTQTFTVNPASQTITFPTIATQTFGVAPFALSATASSSLPVTFSILSGPATISGNMLTVTGGGSVHVQASQAGNASYSAISVSQTFTVNPATQTISFGTLPGKTFGASPFTISATTSSSLPVTFSILSGPATISGNTITLTGAGTVVVQASQAGNTNYSAATPVDQNFNVGQDSQTIGAFATIPSQNFGESPFTITPPTASSGLPVTVTVLSGSATISGNTVTLTGTGAVVLAANQAGNTNYTAAAQVTTSFTVGSPSQTITAFKTIATQTYGVAPFTITPPTASSGLPVTVSVLSGPATISGNTVTITGAGTVVLAANQAGNGSYSAAAQVTTSFLVNPARQTISAFATIATQTYGAAPFTITPPTASSGLPVVITVKSGPATISGNTVTLTGAGTVVLAADQVGNTSYAAAAEVTKSFKVNMGTQTISAFSPIAAQTEGESPFTITPPTASSGLPVTVTVKSGPATISGDTVTLTGSGTVTLSASQAGNANYKAATAVTTSFTVNKGSQTIAAFSTIATQTVGVPLTITPPTASSGLAVTVTVLSGSATISGNTVTLTGIGTVELAANQAGNANFGAATQVTTSFSVNQGSQTIGAFATIASKNYGVAPFTITPPTASSGLPVTITVQSGPATISGDKVTITGVGAVVLAADQAGNANYTAATEVTTSFMVNKPAQTITAFKTIAAKTYGAAPFTITLPTASSGLPVTVTVLSGPATISGNTVTITGAGTVVLAADQAGNSNYAAAPEVTTSFVVSPLKQTITAFGAIATQTYGVAPFTITLPTASSGLPVTVTVLSGPATISGNTVMITGAGTVELAADQAGNANVGAAKEVTKSFKVNMDTQTIAAFSTIPAQTFGESPFTITPPTASSGLPVTVTVKSGPATISGDTVTLTGTGTVVLSASQAGNANYKAATAVTTSFVVN